MFENLIKPSFQFTPSKKEMMISNKHKEKALCRFDGFIVIMDTHFILHIHSLSETKKKIDQKHQASLFCNFIVVHKLYSD